MNSDEFSPLVGCVWDPALEDLVSSSCKSCSV